MSILNQISASTLLLALNTASAATIIGGISLLASRFLRASSPIRHAVCVSGIIGAIMAPVLVLTLRPWTPAVAELVINDRTLSYQGTIEARRATADSAGEPDSRDDALPRQQGSSAVRPMAAPQGENASLSSDIAESSGPAGSPLRSMTSPAAIESGNRSTELEDSGTLGNVTGHTISSVLFLAWLAGSFVFLLRRLAAEYRLRRWLGTCVPVSDAETLRAIKLAATSVGLSEQPLLLQSATLPAPVVCGVLQPRLILPESMADDLSHDQHTAVLTHEMAHLARHDLATGLCLTAARIAYWWNPLVRMLCSRTEDLGEQVCDDIATANLQQPREYASALLGFAERTSSPAVLPAGLGLSMSRISQLEIRIRRILQSTRATTLRVSAKACVVVALMTTVLAAAASMLQIRAASSTDDEPTTQTATTLSGAERPTLDELITRIEAFENAYLPFQLTVTETVRIDEELTPEQRNGVYYADGRVHQRLMEHGMLEPRVWFRSEASQTDGVRGHTHLTYADGSRTVQFQPDQTPMEVYIHDDSDDLMWFAHNSPLMGIIPLSNRSDGEMFSVAVKSGKCRPTLTRQGDDAVLEFSLGEPNFQSSYQWTLSRRHDWHPIRLKTWMSRNEERELISDWAATYLGRDSSGIWRVEHGSVGNFIWEGKSPLVSITGEPMPLHWTDFVVNSAAYGDAVDRAKFKYEIPENASIRMADKPKLMVPTVLEDRELQITVVNPKGEPIVGATVRTSLGEHELESLATDASGQVVSRKRGENVVFIGTEAPGYCREELSVRGAPPTVKIILVPQTEVTVVDEDGQPVPDVYVGADKFRPLSFDLNGLPDLSNLYSDINPRQNRTDENGHYRLAASVTVRTLQNAVPIWSVTDNGDRFGSISVLAVDLGTPQTITLRPSKLIEASLLMQTIADRDRYSWSLLDDSGTRLAGVLPGFRPLGNRTLCSLRFRLPVGDYFLERTVVHREVGQGDPETSRLGFRVEPDQTRVDLGLVDGLSDAIEVDGEWGSVYGRIQVKNATNADLRPRVLLRAQGNVLSEDLLVDPVSEGLEGAFVYLKNTPATIHPDLAEIPATPLAFGVLRSRFVPHTMIVRTGQRVELINSDPVAANIHSFPVRNQALNHIVAPGTRPGRGHLITNQRGERLPFTLTNDLHPWMQAYWLVVDHPYAAITDRHGRFVIENLPPGPHVFNVWHERFGGFELNLEIIIKPGEVTAQPTISVDSTSFSVR